MKFLNVSLPVDPNTEAIEDLIEFSQAFIAVQNQGRRKYQELSSALDDRLKRLRKFAFFSERKVKSIFTKEDYQPVEEEDMSNLNANLGYIRSLNSPDWKPQFCEIDRNCLRYILDSHHPDSISSILHRQSLFNASHKSIINLELTVKAKLPQGIIVKKISEELKEWSRRNFLTVLDVECECEFMSPLEYSQNYIEIYGWPFYVTCLAEDGILSFDIVSFSRLPSLQMPLVLLRGLDGVDYNRLDLMTKDFCETLFDSEGFLHRDNYEISFDYTLKQKPDLLKTTMLQYGMP